MKFEVEAAIEQLDWAIRLFLDHKAYVAAIPLAAAAEKILGKAVGDRSAFEALKKILPGKYSLSEKDVIDDHLNKTKNWLKHWDSSADRQTAHVEFDEEAVQYIVSRAGESRPYAQ